MTKLGRETCVNLHKAPDTSKEFMYAMEMAGIKVPQIYDKTKKEYRKSLSKDTYDLIDHPVAKPADELWIGVIS